MFVRSKFLFQFVEKMEKIMLSLSKQHNKMLKNKFEMLKIRKNVKIIKLEKFSRENPEDTVVVVVTSFISAPSTQ